MILTSNTKRFRDNAENIIEGEKYQKINPLTNLPQASYKYDTAQQRKASEYNINIGVTVVQKQFLQSQQPQ